MIQINKGEGGSCRCRREVVCEGVKLEVKEEVKGEKKVERGKGGKARRQEQEGRWTEIHARLLFCRG